MAWVKLLTQKLRNQSLSEVNPIHNVEAPSLMDDRPSDTESDEENAEICSITESLESTKCSANNQENKPLSNSSSSNTKTTPQPPTLSRSSASPSLTTTTTTVRRPFRQVQPNQQQPQQHYTVDKSQETFLITTTTTTTKSAVMDCTELERLSHDCETAMMSLDDSPERHSSEEELTVINYINVHQAPEKRKWSQMICIEGGGGSSSNSSSNSKHTAAAQTDLQHSSNATSPATASSDEEVKDVLFHMKPSNFSSSPPRGVQRLRKMISPSKFLANVSPTYAPQSCWKSPRKRQRQSSIGDSQATVMQRPCLDLEKMQNSSTSRRHHHHHHHSHHHHGVTRARVVKIKTFNGSGRPSKCVLDPAVFSFRSISTTYNQLTPVEEPCAF